MNMNDINLMIETVYIDTYNELRAKVLKRKTKLTESIAFQAELYWKKGKQDSAIQLLENFLNTMGEDK